MAQIKQRKHPEIDYPSGRGSGLPAAGVHTPDVRLGALPIPANLAGFSGSPSSSADAGFSRLTQKVAGTSDEVRRRIEEIPEISWLKRNEKGLDDLGLSSRVVMEIYTGIMLHTPRDRHERAMIEGLRKRVAGTHGRISVVTEAALASRPLLEFLDPSKPLGDIVADLFSGNEKRADRATAVSPSASRSAAPSFDVDLTQDEVADAIETSPGVREMAPAAVGTGVSALAADSDMTSKALSCHSSAIQALHVGLAIVGVLGDVGTIFGLPIGAAADLINCVINLVCGNYFYALIDLVAVLPIIGDLGKVAYLSRFASAMKPEILAMKAAKSPSEKAKIAAEIWQKMRADGSLGPAVSRFLNRFDGIFKSGSEAAVRLKQMLSGYLDNAISYLERAESVASSGIAAKAASFFTKGRMSVNIAEVLKSIRSKALPKFGEFVESMIDQRKASSIAHGAEMQHGATAVVSDAADVVDEEGAYDPLNSQADFGDHDDIYDDRVSQVAAYPSPAYSGYTGQVGADRDGNGIADEFERAGKRGPYSFKYGRGIYEAAGRAATPPRSKKLNLVQAMEGDDEAVDEMSVAVAGPVLPLGMSTPGKHDPVKASTGYRRVRS